VAIGASKIKISKLWQTMETKLIRQSGKQNLNQKVKEDESLQKRLGM
jgi:hypothetical protein